MYICPDTTEISMLNHEIDEHGFNFEIHVKSAMKTSQDINGIIDRTSVDAKYVRQYFNADAYYR